MNDCKKCGKGRSEEAVKDLVEALTSGDDVKIEAALKHLGVGSESRLYDRVGELARGIHDSLNELKSSLDPAGVTMHTTNIPDAASKLHSVLNMTFDAANKTLEIAEEQFEQYDKCFERLEALGSLLSGPNDLPGDIAKELISFKDEQQQLLKKCHENNQQIVMTQEYQDLSGQSLKKVIKLVTEVEEKLVKLLQFFGGDMPSEKIDTESQEETSLGQEEVDSVLKTLGF